MSAVEIVAPRAQTKVQDFPGRLGRLADSFSQAVAMDHFALRVANALVGAIWKLGQIRPGRDTIRFKAITLAETIELDRALDARIAEVEG